MIGYIQAGRILVAGSVLCVSYWVYSISVQKCLVPDPTRPWLNATTGCWNLGRRIPRILDTNNTDAMIPTMYDEGNHFRRRSSSSDPRILCRLLMMETEYENIDEEDAPPLFTSAANSFMNRDGVVMSDIFCIPIHADGRETDDLIPINNLPHSMEREYHTSMEQGSRYYISITHATIRDGILTTTLESQYTKVTAPSSADNQQTRTVTTKNLLLGTTNVTAAATGIKTVAVIRIHTRDKSPTISKAALENMFDITSSRGVVMINVRTQYRQCSGGQLDWVLAPVGVLDVYLDEPLAHFSGGGGGPIVRAATAKLERMLLLGNGSSSSSTTGGSTVSSLADRVIFCTPRDPDATWVAAAGLNHWRVQFHDEWCLSLTAMMHELGHTLGLTHANKMGEPYGDRTGVMARSFRTVDGPRRCFDGRSHYHLGWFRDRERWLNPLGRRRPVWIDLAAFVDYTKSHVNEPVLVILPGDIYVQYNRAKDHNEGTGEMRDQVTVTQSMLEEGSILLAGLSAGERYCIPNYQGSNRTLVIAACSPRHGSMASEADVFRVSIGMNRSACRETAVSVSSTMGANDTIVTNNPKENGSSSSSSSSNKTHSNFLLWIQGWVSSRGGR